MPKETESRLYHNQLPLTERELNQIALPYQNLVEDDEICICSSFTICRALNGRAPVLCKDVPWRCPRGEMK